MTAFTTGRLATAASGAGQGGGGGLHIGHFWPQRLHIASLGCLYFNPTFLARRVCVATRTAGLFITLAAGLRRTTGAMATNLSIALFTQVQDNTTKYHTTYSEARCFDKTSTTKEHMRMIYHKAGCLLACLSTFLWFRKPGFFGTGWMETAWYSLRHSKTIWDCLIQSTTV